MKDFSPQAHQKLLQSLIKAGYAFQTFLEYFENGDSLRDKRSETKNWKSEAESQKIEKSGEAHLKQEHQISNIENQIIILRQDVEQRYQNALKLAQIQSELGIKGTYYFRILPKCYQPKIVKEIASMGHEIGYHYDDLAACRGVYQKAYDRFQRNIDTLRKIALVKTMSMDGSPLSKYDNRDLWQKYDYKKLGIIAEPYFDLDFNDIFYITDTGRRWDGHLFNVRDKATKENPVTNKDFLKLRFHSTFDLISAIEKGNFPKRAMLNFHPQRWNNNHYLWTKELILQNVKNQVKRFLVK